MYHVHMVLYIYLLSKVGIKQGSKNLVENACECHVHFSNLRISQENPLYIPHYPIVVKAAILSM